MKLFITGLMAVFLTQCTIVTSGYYSSVGTDADAIEYEGVNKTGQKFTFKTYKQNQTKSFKEVTKTVGTLAMTYGTVKGIEAAAGSFSAAEKTKQVGITSDATTKQAKIAADKALAEEAMKFEAAKAAAGQ